MCRAGEPNTEALAVRSDHCAIAIDHTPVHSAVVVALEIACRDPLEIGPAHIAADRADKPVPAPVRCEKRRGRDVGRVFRKRVEPLIKVRQRVEKRGLLRQRKPSRRRRPSPRRRGFVDRAALRDGDRVPGIAVGRMQPATAEIERCCRTDAGRPGPPAEPQPRLHNQAVDARVGEPPPRRDSSRPAANDRHFGIADGHTPFRDGRIQKPAPILTMRGVQP